MSKSRVLVLHSFKDKGYEARLQQIANNPSLDGISFRHCCVIDRDRHSVRISELDRLADQGGDTIDLQNKLLEGVVKVEIGPLLDKQIAEFNPEVVIIHGGTVFNAVPGACLTMIIDLMERHPGLPFALQGKDEWLVRRSGMTYSPFERRWAINQIRWVKQNFIDDEEVEGIIKAIF
jgi:hypothetical protein